MKPLSPVPVCAALVLACQAAPPIPPATAPLPLPWAGVSAAEVVLETRLSKLLPAEAAMGRKLEGRFGVAGGPLAPVLIEPIGASSAFLCQYPKLHLSTQLSEVYVRPWCNDAQPDLPGPGVLSGEALAHALLDALDLPRLETAYVAFELRDAGGGPSRALRALLTEPASQGARRLGGALVDEAALTERARAPDAWARFHLFQLLIGNADWVAGELVPALRRAHAEPGGELHNVMVYQDAAGRHVPLPLDLDLSEVAGVPAPVQAALRLSQVGPLLDALSSAFLRGAPESERLTALRVLDFRRLHGAAADQARDHLLERQAKLEAAIAAWPDPEARRRGEGALARLLDALAPELYLMPRTSASPGGMHTEAGAGCRALPPGVPIEVLDEREGRLQIRLLQRLRLDVRPPAPACPDDQGGEAIEVGWVEAASVERPRSS